MGNQQKIIVFFKMGNRRENKRSLRKMSVLDKIVASSRDMFKDQLELEENCAAIARPKQSKDILGLVFE